MSYSLTE